MAATGRRIPQAAAKPNSKVSATWYEVKDSNMNPWLKRLGNEPYGIHGTDRYTGAARVITLIPRETVSTVAYVGKSAGLEKLVETEEVRDSSTRQVKRFYVEADAKFVAYRPRKKGKGDDEVVSAEASKKHVRDPFTEAFTYAINGKGEWILNFSLQEDGTVRATISPITTRR